MGDEHALIGELLGIVPEQKLRQVGQAIAVRIIVGIVEAGIVSRPIIRLPGIGDAVAVCIRCRRGFGRVAIGPQVDPASVGNWLVRVIRRHAGVNTPGGR